MTNNGLPLRVARAVLNWTQLEAERVSGIPRGALNRYERNDAFPPRFVLECLRTAYGGALATAERHYGEVQTRERGRPRATGGAETQLARS